MVHSDLRRFGIVRDGAGRLALTLSPALLYEALREVLGHEGTVVVPTFSYSWTRGQVYNPATSPSFEGSFSEYVRTLPGARRSLHPLMSVAAMGPEAGALLDGVDDTSFGKGSPFGRMHRADIKHLTVGVSVCSFSDYVQWACRVPYRYAKRFAGVVEVQGRRREVVCEHCVRYPDQGLDAKPIFEVLEEDRSGCIRRTELEGVDLRAVSSSDLFELMRSRLVLDPYAFSRRPREARAIECLARLQSPAVGPGLAVVAVQQEGRERWVWLIPDRLVRVRLSVEGEDGGPAFGIDPMEVYLASGRGPVIEAGLRGDELSRHLVESVEEVTGERLHRAGWLIRPIGPAPMPLTVGTHYRASIQVESWGREESASGHGQGLYLAVLPVSQKETGAQQALRLASEQLLAVQPVGLDGQAVSLVERLLAEGSVVAVLAWPSRGLPAAPVFQPDRSGASLPVLQAV